MFGIPQPGYNGYEAPQDSLEERNRQLEAEVARLRAEVRKLYDELAKYTNR